MFCLNFFPSHIKHSTFRQVRIPSIYKFFNNKNSFNLGMPWSETSRLWHSSTPFFIHLQLGNSGVWFCGWDCYKDLQACSDACLPSLLISTTSAFFIFIIIFILLSPISHFFRLNFLFFVETDDESDHKY